jgi:predicted kinase
LLVGGVGQMGIAGSGQDTMVTEDFLDFEQVDARFD